KIINRTAAGVVAEDGGQMIRAEEDLFAQHLQADAFPVMLAHEGDELEDAFAATVHRGRLAAHGEERVEEFVHQGEFLEGVAGWGFRPMVYSSAPAWMRCNCSSGMMRG